MSHSSLATYTRLSPNVTQPRTGQIMGIAIHCTAGGRNLPAKSVANLSRFVNYDAKYGASCHYAVGGDGSVALICEEKNRAWCTSNKIDHYIVTIEVCSDSNSYAKVNDAALNTLVKLCADIVRRNPKIGGSLRYTANKNDMWNWPKQNIVLHRWTRSDKACPGDYLVAKMPEIVKRVNALLSQGNSKPVVKEDEIVDINKLINEMTDYQAYMLLNKAMQYQEKVAEPDWSTQEGHWKKAVTEGTINGGAPERLIKRDEVIAIMGRKGLL